MAVSQIQPVKVVNKPEVEAEDEEADDFFN